MHYSLISCNFSTLPSLLPPKSPVPRMWPPHLSMHIPTSPFCLLQHTLSLLFVCYLKHITEGWLNNHERKLLLQPWATFFFNWMQLLSELHWMGGGKILSIIWFSFVVSPCQNQINPAQLTDRAAFPCKPLHPSKRALPVIWCSTLLKTEQRGCRKKMEKNHGPAIIILFWFFFPILFFNPSDEVWTGRGMLSQTAISLHHMRLTHRMAGRRGVCREHSQAKGEGRKIHNMKSRVGARWYPVMVVSAASAHTASAARPSCIHRYRNAPNATFHKSHLTRCKMWTLMQVNKWVRYSHKRSQVPTQNGGELSAAWPLPALRM